MMARTHAVGGVLSACAAVVLLSPAPSPPTLLFSLGAGMVGALLPDIDHPQSAMGQQLPIVSDGVSLLMGHRRGVHSLFAAAVVGLAARLGLHFVCPALSPLLAASLVLGYLSHLFLDALNPEGVPFLWPFVERKFGIPLAHTGSLMENWVVFPTSVFILTLFFGEHLPAFGIDPSGVERAAAPLAAPWKTVGKTFFAILEVFKHAFAQHFKT